MCGALQGPKPKGLENFTGHTFLGVKGEETQNETEKMKGERERK